MSMTTPFPEPASPELDRFAVRDPEAVVGLLRDLRDHNVLATLYYDDASSFTVGKLLEIDPATNELVFDCAADNTSRDAICRARELVVVAFLDNAKIQFTLTGSELTTHHGRAAFCSDMPTRLLRMQRRSSPRRQPPATTPVSCLVPVPGEEGRYESTRVLDISLGGIALLVPPVLFDLCTDQRLAASYLDLPGIGQIAVTLRVRYMDAWPGEGGGRRCGCEFVELGGPALRSLQRYMNRLEAETQGAARHAA